MNRIKDILIVSLFVGIILLFTCNGSDEVISDPEIIEVEVFRTDSIHFTDTIVKIVKVPVKSIPLIDTVYAYNDVVTHVYFQKDSLLSYRVEVDSECFPEDVRIEYDVNQFNVRDSIYIRDSVHTKEQIKKSFLSAGAMLTGNQNSFGVAPMLTYSHKKGNNYSLGYDVINGSVMVGFTKKISFKK